MKQDLRFKIFDPSKTLKENCSGKRAPLLLMEDLRMLDYPISRGISYERTVDEFLLQLATNDSLRPLRNCQNAVILLNEEGALIRKDGSWDLLFSPEKTEGQSLSMLSASEAAGNLAAPMAGISANTSITTGINPAILGATAGSITTKTAAGSATVNTATGYVTAKTAADSVMAKRAPGSVTAKLAANPAAAMADLNSGTAAGAVNIAAAETDSNPMDTLLPSILKNLLAEEKNGNICRVRIPERSLKVLVSGIAPFSILDEYCKKQPGGYLAVAERIVYEGIDTISKNVPVCHYGALVSADKEEIENYHTIKSLFEDYIYQFDHAQVDEHLQPLSVGVFGAPGCGKSFGVRQIANSAGRFHVTSLNLSQYHSPAEFFEALKEALECKSSLIPLVFIDEFDSDLNGMPRGWLRYFLAPMQDGEFTLNGKRCEIAAAVFVFAGATASSFPDFLPSTEEEQEAFRLVKGNDFVSRLKGILNIKGPNPTRVTDRSAMIRRGMLLREQIQRKCPGICNNGTVNISRCLLSAMLSVSEYRHGTRSLELILAMSCLSGVKRFTPSCLPMNEQLNLHLKVKDFKQKLEFEQIMGREVVKYAKIAHEHYRSRRASDIRLSSKSEEEKQKELSAPEMASWDELDESYKEGHRSQIRYLGERLEAYDMNIGLRPILPDTADAITDLYGPTLEKLCEIEHERWIHDKKADGWRLGKYDRELKFTDELVPYEELNDETREFIRKSVREVPIYLKEIGYELYQKSF